MSHSKSNLTQDPSSSRDALLQRFQKVQNTTETLCGHLPPEDHMLQCHQDTSPLKWHLGHTAWFFERFILEMLLDKTPVHPQYNKVFNSYYESQGTPFTRSLRGDISRPTLDKVHAYRQEIQRHISDALQSKAVDDEVLYRVLLGINHEEQHQELMLMDLKFNLHINPLGPVYQDDIAKTHNASIPLTWTHVDGLETSLGHNDAHSSHKFSFDHEGPKHLRRLESFKWASRHVTNKEWREFIEDGGYTNPRLWLSDGWSHINANKIDAPLYWKRSGDDWLRFCLKGWVPLEEEAPVCHVSLYEADAFATWCGKRLPTEFEWEHMANQAKVKGNFLESQKLCPESGDDVFGNLWTLTGSPFISYPGYKNNPNALGEYNGKFMIGQNVLRGGSCFTPTDHIRASYRNFFYPHHRWAMQGLRLADNH